jgi:hypothetical protein
MTILGSDLQSLSLTDIFVIFCLNFNIYLRAIFHFFSLQHFCPQDQLPADAELQRIRNK